MNIKELEFDGTKILDFLPKGKTLSQLARDVGVSRQAIHDIAKGRRKPSADLAVRIVTALNISLTDLSKNLNILSANSELFS